MTSEEKSAFCLKGAAGGKFTDVFGCLDTIEAKHNAEEKSRTSGGEKGSNYWKHSEPVDDVIDSSSSGRKSNRGRKHDDYRKNRDSKESGVERMKESGSHQPTFKKPRVPAWKSKTPGYKMNPAKWQCYSLAEVDNSQMSERANTSAALSFLNDLKNRRIEDKTDNDDEVGKIVFKKPKFSKNIDVQDSREASKTETGTSMGGKVVMPEYNFGSKKAKDKPKSKEKQVKQAINDRVCLGHLNEDSDSDEESEEFKDFGNIGVVKVMSSTAVEPHLFRNKGKNKRTIRSKEEDAEGSGD